MIKVTGKFKIRITKNGKYYTTTSTKLQEKTEDGREYDYAPIFVGFRKDVTLDDNTWIEVNDGFLSHFRVSEDERVFNKIIVTDFVVATKFNQQESNDYTVNDDDLPF